MRTKKLATFTVKNTAPFAREHTTLISGVPLRRGWVQDVASLRLRDADGMPISCQCDAQAWWADGSVKWVLVSAPTCPTPARVTLWREDAAPLDGMAPCATTGDVRVDTGILRFTVGNTGPLVTDIAVKVDGQWVTRAADVDLRLCVEHDGARTGYAASHAARTLTVEVDGPLRKVICLRGTHQAADGAATFGPYVLRIEVLAGQAEMRLTHSLVFDGDPDADFIRVSEMTLTAVVGDGQELAFGGDEGRETRFPRQYTPVHADFRHAELYQDAVSHWRLRRWVDRDRRAVFCAEGTQCDGWMELSGASGRVMAAVRDCWQQHPKALAIDAATGEMRIGLYPESAERLDLRRYSDLVYPMAYEAPCTWKDETLPYDRSMGAYGLRKTHDVLLAFDAANPSALAYAYNHPARLDFTPAYLARTQAMLPATTRLDATWRRRTARWIAFLKQAMVRDGGTGYLDYFDLPMGYNPATGRWHHDYGGLGYINDEAMPCLGLWTAALLTGDDDAFALARAMARHNGDIDSHHLGKYAGYGSRHNVNHWGDMCKEPRISQPIAKRFLYYLSGDRSPLDLLQVVLDMFRHLRAPSRLPITAHLPALVSTLLTTTETGLADETAWLRQIADALAASVDADGRMTALLAVDPPARTAWPLPDSGALSFMMFSCFGGAQSLAELAERYDHQPLRDALVRLARYQMLPRAERAARENAPVESVMVESLNTFRALDLLGYAYQLTGDPAIAAHVRRHLQHLRVDVADHPEMRYGYPTGSRTGLACTPWPDRPAEEERAAMQRYYPVPGIDTAHFFEMAVYLHKMQAVMLMTGAGR